jgi:hypothetical protein
MLSLSSYTDAFQQLQRLISPKSSTDPVSPPASGNPNASLAPNGTGHTATSFANKRNNQLKSFYLRDQRNRLGDGSMTYSGRLPA